MNGDISSVNGLELYVPQFMDLHLRQELLSDPDTMAYNAVWYPPDGCVPFPASQWQAWYDQWIGRRPERYYAYLRRKSDGAFVGEVDYHRSGESGVWEIGIVISASCRGKGYGQQGLALLVDQAFREDRIPCLHNDFEASRTAACRIHRECGFRETGQHDGITDWLLSREEYENKERCE